MILCDTNILIELYKNNEAVKHNLRQIGLPDLAISALIAATAIQNDMAFYTLNVKDFKYIPSLQLHLP